MMSTFINIKQAVHKQFTLMISTGMLLTTNVSKDALWDTYLGSFLPEDNPVFRERTEHDCNCCKRYIRTAGNAVAFIDGKLVTMWDVKVDKKYQRVVDALAKKVRNSYIKGIFLNDQENVGADKTPDLNTDIIWDHFFMKLPTSLVKPKEQIPTLKGKATKNHAVLKRSITEISDDAIDSVLDLISNDLLYRGAEHKARVLQLKQLKEEYAIAEASGNPTEYLWRRSLALGEASSFRNSVIGTLLVDLSDGDVPLESAVKSFETKVAPTNYKRSKSLITQKDIDRANATIQELGMESSLTRRAAVIEDITINDVLFADRTAAKSMGVLDILAPTAAVKTDSNKGIIEIAGSDFIENVVPRAESMRLLVENKHKSNLVSLVSPVHADAPNILKWNNNFSFSYNGEVTDSMQENVKAAGGKVDGALRFSIQWNTPDRPNGNDLDAQCMTPNGKIDYANKTLGCGTLDVDIMTPNGIAVENIIHTDLNKMPDGHYHFETRNYSSRTAKNGFTAQIAFDNQLFNFDYGKPMLGRETVNIGTVRKKGNTLELISSIEHEESTHEIWGLSTQQYVKVETVMYSPNHWENSGAIGNKHVFFMLEGCKNPEPVRGLYNEFLSGALHDHRKVFEVLGSKLKVPFSEHQLSGLGFSETIRQDVTVEVRGEINRTYKVKF